MTSCKVIPSTISDHFPLVCEIPFVTSSGPQIRGGRNTSRIDMRRFAADLLDSDLETFTNAQTVDVEHLARKGCPCTGRIRPKLSP